jgi:hypothetical protein
MKSRLKMRRIWIDTSTDIKKENSSVYTPIINDKPKDMKEIDIILNIIEKY